MVAIAEGSAVLGQSVRRWLRVSCRVAVPSMVETSSKSKGRIQDEVEGPTSSPAVLTPTTVGIIMYTEGETLF